MSHAEFHPGPEAKSTKQRVPQSAAEASASSKARSSASGGAASPRLTQFAAIVRSSTQAGAVAPLQRKENRTGLPDSLKAGVESLSGLSLDHVRVHRNSPQPAQLNAHAFAQGSDIHLAPGQDKHLAHEAWHVVQQTQGRVAPTFSAHGVAINDSTTLEREADTMGAKAVNRVAPPPPPSP